MKKIAAWFLVFCLWVAVWPAIGYWAIAMLFGLILLLLVLWIFIGTAGLLGKSLALLFGEAWLLKRLTKSAKAQKVPTGPAAPNASKKAQWLNERPTTPKYGPEMGNYASKTH